MGFPSDDLKIGYPIQAMYKGNIFKHRTASILIPYISILYLFSEKCNWITANQMFQIVVSLPQPTAYNLLHLSDRHIIQNIVCYLSSPCRYIFKLYFLNAA